MDFGFLYTSFDGRINRAKYWLATIILIVIVFAIMFGVGIGLGMAMDPEDFKFKVVVFILQLLFLYPSTAVMVKRLHDRNRPGSFAAFMIVPIVVKSVTDLLGYSGDPTESNGLDYALGGITFIVAIWFFIELGCLRGTIGDNQYGPDPLAGKV